MESWSEDKCLNLILLYYKNPELWNPALTAYKNKNVRNNKWFQIAETLALPVSEAKKKMRYLICHFTREVKREKDSALSAKSTEEVYFSKWFAYNSLSFLKDRNIPRQTFDTEEFKASPQHEEESLPALLGEAYSLASSTQPTPATPTVQSEPKQKKRTSSQSEESDLMLDVMQVMKDQLTQPEDRFDVFGKYTAMRLRDLDTNQRILAEKLFNETLCEAEMGNLTPMHKLVKF